MSTPWHEQPPEWRAGYQRGYHAGLSGVRSRGVRITAEGEFEMRCPDCARQAGAPSYWPLTREFWNRGNLSACRACLLARKRRAAKRAYWADPKAHRARAAEYERLNRGVILMKKRARYAADPATAQQKNAEWRAAHRDAVRAYRRAYYARNRDRILYREKLRRAGVLGAEMAA